MKKALNNSEARTLFRRIGQSIDEDKERGLFGNPEVAWQGPEPVTAEDIANNIFERMRGMLGAKIGIDTAEADPIALARFLTARGSL